MKRNRKVGVLVTTVIALIAVALMTTSFISNASPYVDVAQALQTQGDTLHLLGNIDKKTVRGDVSGRLITFDLIDVKQRRIHVTYDGEPISNIGEADRVVAVGGVTQGDFHASKLLIKCPSKYDDARSGTAKSV